MKNTLTFSSIINILIDNKKNTYPQYLLVADLFSLDFGIDCDAGETLGVTDSNTIRISNQRTVNLLSNLYNNPANTYFALSKVLSV